MAFINSNSWTAEPGGCGDVAPHFTNLMLKQLHFKTVVKISGEAYKLNAEFLSQVPPPLLVIALRRLCYLYQVKIHVESVIHTMNVLFASKFDCFVLLIFSYVRKSITKNELTKTSVFND